LAHAANQSHVSSDEIKQHKEAAGTEDSTADYADDTDGKDIESV